MIEIKNTQVTGLSGAIEGMRFPMNSDHLSDSYWLCAYDDVGVARPYEFKVGEKDLALASKLSNAGSDHGKFLRMIHVQCDITAPLYWWKEADTYKVATVANSRSTMHKIHSKEFTLDDFSHEHLIDNNFNSPCSTLHYIISKLNFWRDRYNETDEERKDYFDFDRLPYVPTKKQCWWQMIQLLPSSYNQQRKFDCNYATLKNIYHARKNHRLDEWHDLCDWIETLPYAKELIIGESN